MATVPQLLDRMLAVLSADEGLRALVTGKGGAFRLGRLPKEHQTRNVLPLVYVTPAPSYVHSRMALGGPVAEGASPREAVTYVIHAVAVSRPAGGPEPAQAEAFAIAEATMRALSQNLVLADADGGDPLAQDITMESMSRYMPSAGTTIEAVTTMCLVRTTVDHGAVLLNSGEAGE